MRAVVAPEEGAGRDPEDPDLVVELDDPLPGAVPEGPATALFCTGTCFHRRSDVVEVQILVDGCPHPAIAHSMPRLGLFRRLHPGLDHAAAPTLERDDASSGDPELRSYRSGFWAIVPIPPSTAGEGIELSMAVRLADGRSAGVLLNRIDVIEPEVRPLDAPPIGGKGELIAICMATYDPDAELFARQVESLRSQTDRSWVCVISDDRSRPERFERIVATIGDDPRFVVSRPEVRLGFYRNFERALGLVPTTAALVALCDQDDVWYPEKLEVLRGALGDAELVYSDQRLVDREGTVLRESLWKRRRSNHSNLASMLLANTIVGAATLFPRRVLGYALPFPEGPGWQFHDHWLGMVALASGDVAYVDRPLYDYVQHPGAIVSRVGVEERGPHESARERLRRLRRPLQRWRAIYFRSYLPLALQARVILLRCSRVLTPRKRRALQLLIRAADSPVAFAWLALRPLREGVGRNETLGTETHLLKGILWFHLSRIRVRGGRRPGVDGYDAEIPAFDPIGFGQVRLKRWLAGG